MKGQGDGLNRHLAAVMFTDMAGYTALMQRDEEAALRSRSRHREALERTASERGGRVLQYFGDGSLSLFPSSIEAVNAAVAIQRELQRDPLVRIGLHLGEVAYDDQGAYGDAINIAARLEALATPGGVLISRKVFDEIQPHPELRAEHVADVRLRHVRGSVATYALIFDGFDGPDAHAEQVAATPLDGGLPPVVQGRLDERAKAALPPGVAAGALPGRIPLVGRKKELEAVHRLVGAAERGRGATLFVRGSRGVGKTRIAEEAAAYARGRGWAVLSGRAYAAEERIPFAPFVDALLPILRGLDRPTLESLAPGGVDAILALLPALGVDAAGAKPAHLAPGEFQARLFWHFSELLGRLAEYRPLLLILEDLDFVDRSSLDLLRFVSRQCVNSPIVVMCQYTGMDEGQKKALLDIERSLRAEGAGGALEVQPLSEEETALFITRTLSLSSEPRSELSSRLFRWTEGVPFFLEGTLRGLVAAGRLRVGADAWAEDDTDALDLPQSVRDAVFVWTSRLSPGALALAELLAVAGTRLTHESLQYVAGLPESEMVEALDELVRHQVFTEEEAEWTLVYDFRHPLIRETLRTELSAARRRQMHGRIAESLERFYGADVDEHAEELAYHFGQAPPGPARVRAVRYLAEAGARALTQYANREAAAHFREALERFEVVRGGPQREELAGVVTHERLVMGLANAQRRLGRVDETVALLTGLLPEVEAAGDARTCAVIHRAIGLALMGGGRMEEALAAFARGVAVARETGIVPLLVRIQLAEGLCHQAAGRADDARRVLEEAHGFASELGEPTLLARTHSALVQLHLFSGNLTEGRVHAETALRLAAETSAEGVAFWSNWAMGAMEGLIGNTAQMARWVAEAQRLADKLGSPFLKTATAELQVELAYARGEWTDGIARGERAADLCRTLGQRTVLPRLLTWLSLMYIGRGELEKARAATDEAWRVGRADRALDRVGSTDVHTVVPAHIGRAAYHMALGEWGEAVRVAEAGLSIADRSGYVVWAIHHLLPIIAEASIHARNLDMAMETGQRMRREAEAVGHPLGLAWADACDAILTWLEGDAARGAVAMRQGVTSLESIPLTYEAAKLRRQLAGRLLEAGDPQGAADELRKAEAVFERLGATPELVKARKQLGEIDGL